MMSLIFELKIGSKKYAWLSDKIISGKDVLYT